MGLSFTERGFMWINLHGSLINMTSKHWQVIVGNVEMLPSWHKPHTIKDACVPGPATNSTQEQKLNSIVS